MSSIKSALIILTTLLSMSFIWALVTPEIEPDQLSEILAQQKKLVRSNNALLNRIETLENSLAELQSIRQQHELQLSELEQQIPTSVLHPDMASIEAEEKQPEAVIRTTKPPTLQEKLVTANIQLDTIQRIKQRVGENRLARLQLRDQAIREDWIDSPEYIEKEQQLPSPTGGLREEFGDQVYDQYLYASGRPNRIIVREVFSGSAAEEAGIEARDIILSYASKLIFTMNELQQATTEGNSGEPVLIEILRDDLPFTTSAPRGPLGISMTISRKKPE